MYVGGWVSVCVCVCIYMDTADVCVHAWPSLMQINLVLSMTRHVGVYHAMRLPPVKQKDPLRFTHVLGREKYVALDINFII